MPIYLDKIEEVALLSLNQIPSVIDNEITEVVQELGFGLVIFRCTAISCDQYLNPNDQVSAKLVICEWQDSTIIAFQISPTPDSQITLEELLSGISQVVLYLNPRNKDYQYQLLLESTGICSFRLNGSQLFSDKVVVEVQRNSLIDSLALTFSEFSYQHADITYPTMEIA